MTPEQEREAVVAWLREEAEKWWLQVEGYRKAGNYGPYFGGPCASVYADAIERGEHKKGEQ